MKYVKGASLIETIGVSAEEISRMIEAQVLPFPVTIDGKARTPETDECLYCRRATGGEAPCFKGGSFFVCKSASQEAQAERIRTALFDKGSVDKAMPAVRELFSEGPDQAQGFTGTPEAFVQACRERDIHDARALARLVDEEFTDSRRLSDLALGRLLPADPTRTITDKSVRDRGKRLRGKKK